MRFLRNGYQKTGDRTTVAIFHLSVKPISRSAGRSATGAAAYRAGEKILDERTGETHDYRKRGGVESADIVLPDGAPAWANDRAKLWNAAELAEKRKDACVAREFEVALPAELSPAERRNLAFEFAKDMANREGCAVDVCIHAPGKEGDNRNHHAHIMRTTRKVEQDGMGAKLDTEQAGRNRKADLEQVRERWGRMCNSALERAGHKERVNHRSLEAQGIDRMPTVHLGPAATAIQRRAEPIYKTEQYQERKHEAADLAQQIHDADDMISSLSLAYTVSAATNERAIKDGLTQAQRDHVGDRILGNVANQTKKNLGIDPRSLYHPDNVAKQPPAAPVQRPDDAVARIERLAVQKTARAHAERQLEQARAAPQKPKLAELPMADQAKAFDMALEKLSTERQKKADRVAAKTAKRQERRERAVQAVLRQKPEQPRGMLASFKQRAFNEAMDTFKPVYARARKLADQAGALRDKVSKAAASVYSWAHAKLEKANPGLADRVQAHRKAERLAEFRRQEAEREKSRGKDRGMER